MSLENKNPLPILNSQGEEIEYALAGMTTDINTLVFVPLFVLAVAGLMLWQINKYGKLPWE